MILLPVHPDPKASDEEGCTFSIAVFPFLPSQQTKLLPLPLLLHISTNIRQPLHDCKDIHLFTVLPCGLKEPSSAQCSLLGHFFLDVWSFLLLPSSCSALGHLFVWTGVLQIAYCSCWDFTNAKYSRGIVLYALHSIFHLYSPSMVSCFASLYKVIDSMLRLQAMHFVHIFSPGLLLSFSFLKTKSLFHFNKHCSHILLLNIHWKCWCSFREETQTLELTWVSILKIKMQTTWKLYQSMSWWDVIISTQTAFLLLSASYS